MSLQNQASLQAKLREEQRVTTTLERSSFGQPNVLMSCFILD
jgi:hypothetical protein